MPKNTKKNAQPKDDLEESLSDDLQAETDQGIMKYMVFISLSTRPNLNVTISARLLSKCSWSSLPVVLNISAGNIFQDINFFIAGKKGSSRGFQTQKETRYNEARKKGKELVRDGIAYLYRYLSSFQQPLLKSTLEKMHKKN